MNAMQDRFACKLFDKEKKVSTEDRDYILEAGRLSPSSIGLEQWKFLVVESDAKKQALQPACWNQPQISTASFVVVILGRLSDLEPNSAHIHNRLMALTEGNADAYEGTKKFYEGFYNDNASQLPRWSSEQCHIAGANMMTAASVRSIASCPIGGFVEEKVKKALDINDGFMVSLIIPFGYCAKPGRKKDRLPMDTIAEFI